jgi:RsiW-degrading membrane proteinase PrsW (M82 family)
VCPEFIYDGLLILSGAGMGFTTVENISKVFGKPKPNETEQ